MKAIEVNSFEKNYFMLIGLIIGYCCIRQGSLLLWNKRYSYSGKTYQEKNKKSCGV